MAVLVIADHDGAAVRETTHKTVTAAAKLGGDVDILVVGKGAKAATWAMPAPIWPAPITPTDLI